MWLSKGIETYRSLSSTLEIRKRESPRTPGIRLFKKVGGFLDIWFSFEGESELFVF